MENNIWVKLLQVKRDFPVGSKFKVSWEPDVVLVVTGYRLSERRKNNNGYDYDVYVDYNKQVTITGYVHYSNMEKIDAVAEEDGDKA